MYNALHTLLDFLRESLRRHLLRTVLVIVLVPVGALSAVSLVFPFQREIVYDLHTVFADCRVSGTGQCVARMELVIGNTGDTDEAVSLTWPRFEGPWSRDHNVLDVSADRPRTRDPVIDCSVTEGRQDCRIDGFAAGALLIMRMDCFRCSPREVALLEETPLEIRTGAHTTWGDPRMTLLFRRLLGLARLFM